MEMNKENWLVKQGIFLSGIAICASLLSFAKEAVFAGYFGVSSVADAYTIAIQVPEILFAVVWEAISAVVIPLYTERLRLGDKKDSQKFISNLLTIICLASVTFIFLGEFLTDFIVMLFSPGLPTETHNLAVNLMRWILPMLFFEGITRICTGILNVHKQFVIPRILTAWRNIGVIVFLVLFANEFGVYAAAYGVLCGIIIECILCYLITLRKEKIKPHIDFRDSSIKKAGQMIVPLIIGIGVAELNQMADKIVASFLDAGSISSLNYASKLSSIIQTVLLSNIVTVLYPTYSSLAALGKKKELAEIYVKTVKVSLLLCVPIVFGGVFFRKEIVSLAFERGSFDSTSVNMVAMLFSVYLLNTLFTTVNGASVKLFTSCYDTKTSAINSAIGVAINIVLNIVLSRFFGVFGLTIATMLSSMVICLRLFLLVRKKVFKFSLKPIIIMTFKIIICGALMFVSLVLIRDVLLQNFVLVDIWSKAVYCVVGVAIGAVIFGVLLFVFRVLKIEEITKKMFGGERTNEE